MTTTTHGSAKDVDRPRVAYVLGVGAYLVVITVKLSTTTNASNLITDLLMIIAAVVTIACLAQLSNLRAMSRRQVATAAMFLGLVTWAVLGSMVSQSLHFVTMQVLIDICLVGVGLMIFSRGSGKVLPDGFSRFIVAYVALAFCVNLVTGGLILEFPPRFSFEYSSDQYGGEIGYGQGASNFYGLGAIAAAFWLTHCRRFPEKALAATLMVCSMALSVMGGARGDTAIALLIVAAYLFLRAPVKAVIWTAVLVMVAVLLIDDWEWTGNLLFVSNMLTLAEGNFGARDELFLQALTLLGIRPMCLIAGCGVGYFQYFHGYEESMYPHNIVLESVVTFGLPLTVLLMVLALRGGVMYVRRVGGCDLFLLLLVYALAVSLKSGSFFGSWLALAGCLYLASHTFIGIPGGACDARVALTGNSARIPGSDARRA